MNFKELLKKLSYVGVDLNYSLDSGLTIGGVNLSLSRHPYAKRSSAALKRCLAIKPKRVLDVGSGGGEHAKAFNECGAEVTCVDFGTSIYAKNFSAIHGVSVINADFQNWQNQSTYDLVWASHVLEHQRNCGAFIEKLIDCCDPGGKIAITVPTPHRRLWGGHLSQWTPGLLAYNIVLCGVDLSDSMIFYGYREISIIFTPKRAKLPQLTFDSGDLLLLRNLLPHNFSENVDSWI